MTEERSKWKKEGKSNKKSGRSNCIYFVKIQTPGGKMYFLERKKKGSISIALVSKIRTI